MEKVMLRSTGAQKNIKKHKNLTSNQTQKNNGDNCELKEIKI